VAEALEGLPELSRALGEGALSWSSARELTRVAAPETERSWLEAAQGRTVREVEKLVSGHRMGDLPNDQRDEGAVRHVLRFDVSGEVMATFREAMTQLRREAGESLDDDAALLLMARQILAGPGEAQHEDGRASYQVAVTVCEMCRRASQVGGGEAVEIPAPVLEMARCDAQVLPDTHVGGESSRATQTVPPAKRRAVLRRDQHRCRVPGCHHAAFVDVHHIETREDGGGHELENLLTLCGAHHRASHRGNLIIEGSSDQLHFLHADGTAYGGRVSADAAEIQSKAFLALRAFGFGEREARRALVEATTHVGPDDDLDLIIRAALERLSAHALAEAS
jgi:5-methylcytosine-specific restriction endonuclease McrA